MRSATLVAMSVPKSDALGGLQPGPAEYAPDPGRWEWGHIACAAACRFAQDSVLWAIIGAFLGTNAILLVALFSTGTFPTSSPARIIPCIMGMISSFLWWIMQAAALRRVKWYETVVLALQVRVALPEEYEIFSNPDRERGPRRRRLPRARTIMPVMPLLAIAAWTAGLLFAIFGR